MKKYFKYIFPALIWSGCSLAAEQCNQNVLDFYSGVEVIANSSKPNSDGIYIGYPKIKDCIVHMYLISNSTDKEKISDEELLIRREVARQSLCSDDSNIQSANSLGGVVYVFRDYYKRDLFSITLNKKTCSK